MCFFKFADKAVERGTMVRGYHGQSAKNIAQYKKTGVPPTVSGLNPSTSGYHKATQDWMKRTGANESIGKYTSGTL